MQESTPGRAEGPVLRVCRAGRGRGSGMPPGLHAEVEGVGVGGLPSRATMSLPLGTFRTVRMELSTCALSAQHHIAVTVFSLPGF